MVIMYSLKNERLPITSEMIVALVDDGATVKRFYKDKALFVFSLKTIQWSRSLCRIALF